MPSTVVIVNPASGRGRGARVLPALRAAFAAHGISDIRLTGRSGDEARLVRSALDDGATTIAIAGGDGTWGRCAGAVLDNRAGDAVRLAFISAGTGNDFAKNLGAPTRDVNAMASLIADPSLERRVDAGAIECGGATHWFLNVAGFGFDAVVLEDTRRGGRLGESAVYIGAALRRLFTYPGFAYTEGGPDGESRVAMMLVFSNGSNFGGAFRIAPNARVDDGLLDQIHIGNVRGIARLPLFVSALRGAHLSHPKVRAARRARFVLTFSGAPACDLDGELLQLAHRDVVVRSVPGALRVAAPVPPSAA
ncbi:MAG: diacylglycerol kinase family lipid kinase [Gemmatimonadetes bacterium]|nr:diacylglycerol kinase family lipid kinase [Gemmatimonadota bacterium]